MTFTENFVRIARKYNIVIIHKEINGFCLTLSWCFSEYMYPFNKQALNSYVGTFICTVSTFSMAYGNNSFHFTHTVVKTSTQVWLCLVELSLLSSSFSHKNSQFYTKKSKSVPQTCSLFLMYYQLILPVTTFPTNFTLAQWVSWCERSNQSKNIFSHTLYLYGFSQE